MLELDKNIFGLDISDRALRLAEFTKKGKKLILTSFAEFDLPQNVISNGEIINENALINGIKQVTKSVQGKKIRTQSVISVLPETKTFIKVINIETPKDDKDLQALIIEEMKNHIPLEPEDIYLDWQILNTYAESTKVLVGAAPRLIVDSYFGILEKAGYTPYILEIEAAAIIRSLISANDKKAKVVIDFGANRTGLIVYDDQAPQFTVTLPISGNQITKTIAQKLQLNLDKAEKAKIVCGLDMDKCEGALLKILTSTIEDIGKEIKKAMLYYKRNFSDAKPISEIIICGGGANFSGIDKVLGDILKIPIKIGDPFTNAVQSGKIKIPNNKILSYTTTIGLALRKFQK